MGKNTSETPAPQNAVKSTDSAAPAVEKKAEKKESAPQAAKPDLKPNDTHYVMCDSITSRRGVLCKNQGCRAQDFPGDEKQIEELVKRKAIKKV